VVIAFPSMAGGARSRMQTQALGLILAIGAAATAAAWVLAPLAVLFVGGHAYTDLESRIWAFAAVGTLWALIQLVVYGAVARQQQRAVGLLWVGLAVLVGLGLLVGSVDQLLLTVASVEAAVLLLLLLAGSLSGLLRASWSRCRPRRRGAR
jgi:hypothetical protein